MHRPFQVHKETLWFSYSRLSVLLEIIKKIVHFPNVKQVLNESDKPIIE